MKVGDVVIPIGGNILRSGCSQYPCAIVADIEPFTLVSVEGDMLWSASVRPEEFLALCQASASVIETVIQRLKSHEPPTEPPTTASGGAKREEER